MEFCNSDNLLNRKLLNLGINIFKLVEFFEHSNVYDFIQKILPSEFQVLIQRLDIPFHELFDWKKVSENLNKIPYSWKFMFSKMIAAIDNLISDLAFVLQSPSNMMENYA